FSAVPVDREASMFDLTLYFTEMEDGLSGTIEYNTDLFDEGTIERLAAHFEQLLGSIAANPDERLSRLSMLTPAEEQRLISEWNDTAQDYPRERCLHQLCEEQVERTPLDTALICGEYQISFAELNSRANQLAHYLRSKGVGPEVAVGIMLDRSLELIVGLLAILKAGGAYVPLDPQYPQQRLSFMLADSQANLVITDSKYAEVLPDSTAQLVAIDKDSQQIAAESEQNLAAAASGANLAYIMYTSGSTGQPKGVAVPQRAVHNL